MQEHYEFIAKSLHKIEQIAGTKREPHQYLTSVYSEEDMDNMQFLERIEDPELLELIGGRKPSWANRPT